MIRLERSSPAPKSLREQRHYDTPEVRDRLYLDAFGKCYLCERLVDRSDFQIDHRKPKALAQFQKLTFSWSNLFCCCAKCNGLRFRHWPEGGLLLPDRLKDDPEQRLKQYLDNNALPSFRAKDPLDQAAQNTAHELLKVHGAEDKLRADDLQRAILLQLEKARSTRQRMWELENEGRESTPSYARLRDELRRLVSRRAPYTAMIRSRFLRDKLVISLFD